jgi:hypothetical protein
MECETSANELTEARLALGTGLFHVFQVMDEEHRPQVFQEMLARCFAGIEDCTTITGDATNDDESIRKLSKFCEDIRLAAGLIRSFSSISRHDNGGVNLQNGGTTDCHTELLKPYVVSTIHKALPGVYQVLSHLPNDEVRTFKDYVHNPSHMF